MNRNCKRVGGAAARNNLFHLPDEGNHSALETIDQEFCEQVLIFQYETNHLGGKVAV